MSQHAEVTIAEPDRVVEGGDRLTLTIGEPGKVEKMWVQYPGGREGVQICMSVDLARDVWAAIGQALNELGA